MITGILVALALAQAPAPRQTAPQTDETVPVQRGSRLAINNFAGEVIIHTWDKDSVHVVARHQAPGQYHNTAPQCRQRQRDMGWGSVDYDITAPAWMPVKVRACTSSRWMACGRSSLVRGDIVIRAAGPSPPVRRGSSIDNARKST